MANRVRREQSSYGKILLTLSMIAMMMMMMIGIGSRKSAIPVSRSSQIHLFAGYLMTPFLFASKEFIFSEFQSKIEDSNDFSLFAGP